ncbi:hypothetical protein D0868_01758 [Hortaea werneckii]|uniref:Heterokaryon incompatibility domain-containing protein n=1 Tax=Hortaea werneckii TaxID=91943 RepID=A0A3M6ZF36_HORWE|nr:hypothetical protein D0868_01758 [Hortaea werneckii]
MPVQLSPRQRDSLDYEEPDVTDSRLMFRSLSLESSEYDHYDTQADRRPSSGGADTSTIRRRARQRRSDVMLLEAPPFNYNTVADGDVFRFIVLLPGNPSSAIECQLLLENAFRPSRTYRCLSYCWGSEMRDAAILCDGFRFPVTKNLHRALKCPRKPKTNVLIWVDQICINQFDAKERAHQVTLMKHIFSHARKVVIWLGEEADKSKELCDYAEKMRDLGRTERSSSSLGWILSPKHLQDAMQSLLNRPWFQRVWVIPEVALAQNVDVVCGGSRITWDNLVRLIRDTQLPETSGFNKQTALPGNPRQRIAIISQMIASQRKALLHTDITQLLILAKSSQATEVRDKVYAFYGLTLLSTYPDYNFPVEKLYVDITEHYINSLLWDDYYSRWHGLSEQQRTQQLMSILYSAGKLHQHLGLPSWIPDWTFAWYQAPFWCKTDTNVPARRARNDWSLGIRSDFRAGGETRGNFELVPSAMGRNYLKLSVVFVDTVSVHVDESVALSSALVADRSPKPSPHNHSILGSSAYSYGRDFFLTVTGAVGMATRGIRRDDRIAIVLGADVPFVLRQAREDPVGMDTYELLCECFLEAPQIMDGTLAGRERSLAKDVLLV